MHNVVVVDEGLDGDEVVLLVTGQLEVEADVGRLFGRHFRGREAESDVHDVCNKHRANGL